MAELNANLRLNLDEDVAAFLQSFMETGSASLDFASLSVPEYRQYMSGLSAVLPLYAFEANNPEHAEMEWCYNFDSNTADPLNPTQNPEILITEDALLHSRNREIALSNAPEDFNSAPADSVTSYHISVLDDFFI